MIKNADSGLPLRPTKTKPLGIESRNGVLNKLPRNYNARLKWQTTALRKPEMHLIKLGSLAHCVALPPQVALSKKNDGILDDVGGGKDRSGFFLQWEEIVYRVIERSFPGALVTSFLELLVSRSRWTRLLPNPLASCSTIICIVCRNTYWVPTLWRALEIFWWTKQTDILPS